MKEGGGLRSKSCIHRRISAREERGFLRLLPNRARALEVLKVPEAAKPARENVVPLRKPATAMRPIAANDIVEVPLHGKIAARAPYEALEEDRTSVSRRKSVSVRSAIGGRRIIKNHSKSKREVT